MLSALEELRKIRAADEPALRPALTRRRSVFLAEEDTMSLASGSVDNKASPLSLPDLLTTLNALGVEFCRRGEVLELSGDDVLSAELKAAVAEHKAVLLTLCDCRAELSRLHDYLIRLRCENPPKGTRQQALAYQASQIEKMAARSVELGGTENGWPDPSDVFADGDQIEGLRQGLAELSRADAPYPVPLPEGCVLLPQANFDPFAHGRLYNGMISV